MTRVLFVFLLITGVLHAQLGVTDLDFPLFDSSGRLVRRLKAASGTGSLKVSVLKSGTVEFFGTESATSEKIGTLTFDIATYQAATEIIESEGPMQLRFANGILSAVGFRYELLKGRLILKSAVVLDSAEAHAVGREGEVLLSQEKNDRDMLVSVATIRGDVVITEIKIDDVAVERVETASATYTGSDSLLRPAVPVIIWNQGKRGEMKGEISLRIPRRASPLAPPSPQASPGFPTENGAATPPTPRR